MIGIHDQGFENTFDGPRSNLEVPQEQENPLGKLYGIKV